MGRLGLLTVLFVLACSAALGADSKDLVSEKNRVYSVVDYGASGDGKTDDTGAFQKALDAAAKTGGTVLVPSQGAGSGYVLSRTVKMPSGVALVGSLAGFSANGSSYFPPPAEGVVGSKIFARPAKEEYSGKTKAPLFDVGPGCTVRGLYILYDEQPWPSDEEFQDAKSLYYYKSFEEARGRFVKEHVKPYGPTFYVNYSPNVVIEDIACDRYFDFIFIRQAGKSFINRIFCYGYHRAFTYWEGLDVNRISHVHCVPNIGPISPGKMPDGKTYSWIYGIVASDQANVGIQMGRNDGYIFDDVFFFGIHTALQLGASKDYPVGDPVKGDAGYYDPDSKKLVGFSFDPYQGNGPWGEIHGLKAEACVIGIRFVWPSPLTNRVANAMIFTGIDDGRDFAATAGTGDIKGVGKQGAFVVEPTYSAANNGGGSIRPVFMCANANVASFKDTLRGGPAAANAMDANGRVFLLDGDVTMDFSGFQMVYPYTPDYVCARGANAGKNSIKIRGFIQTGEPAPDVEIDGAVVSSFSSKFKAKSAE